MTMRARVCLWLVGLTLLAAPLAAAPLDGGYAVVVSQATDAQAEWHGVVQALAAKYDAQVISWRDAVTESREPLKHLMPRYAAFVARPTEAGRPFVVAVSRLTRGLADDAYTDVLWGIVTGYEPADALRMVNAPPLIIHRGLGGTAIPLDAIGEGTWFDEGRRGHMVVKTAGGPAHDEPGPDDPAETIAELLNTAAPDLWVTSGHATERDWQMGYSYPAGQLRCQHGQLLSIPRDGIKISDDPAHPGRRIGTIVKAFPIHSANPKVYLAMGNCLIGHLADRESMAAAWLHSGGADQMVGYTVVTWFGYMGWGVGEYGLGQAGRFTVAEAFYASQQALLYRLATEFPGKPQLDLTEADYASEGAALGAIAAKLGYGNPNSATAHENLGLLWDRDVVALYGDPAWEARLAPRTLPWDQTVTIADGRITIAITARAAAKPGRPILVLLPGAMRAGRVLEGADLQPVVARRFVMLPKVKSLAAGQSLRVVLEAAP